MARGMRAWGRMRAVLALTLASGPARELAVWRGAILVDPMSRSHTAHLTLQGQSLRILCC